MLAVHGLNHVYATPDRLCTVQLLQGVRFYASLRTFYPPARWTLAGAFAVAIFPMFIEECLALALLRRLGLATHGSVRAWAVAFVFTLSKVRGVRLRLK